MNNNDKIIVDTVNTLIDKYESLKVCKESIIESIKFIVDSYNKDGKVMVCGNGGSAADSLHIVGELVKSFKKKRPLYNDFIENISSICIESDYIISNLEGSLPAISLVNEVSLLTAYATDKAPDLSFAQQVYGQGKKNDILIAISTSGNSANVLYAAEVAKAKNIKVIGLTGGNGGKLSSLADISICVPESEVYRIQELHLPVYHCICLALENVFWQ